MTAAEAMAIGMLGAAAAAGDPDRLREALDRAVEVLSAEDIDELLLQTYLFAGFPRTINAFYTWQSWAMRRGGRGEPRTEGMRPARWRERGERLCRLIYSGNFEALQIRLARLHPELSAWTLVEGYGKVLSRPGPPADVREMAAVGALIAMGERRQLASHLQGARHTGVQADVLASAARAVAVTWDRKGLVEELLTGLDDG
ncbi:MAG: carboxymuconolactone decarboxylase family protein [Gemmatimonadota bacterium]